MSGILEFDKDMMIRHGISVPKEQIDNLKVGDMEQVYHENENAWNYRDYERGVHEEMLRQFQLLLPDPLHVVDLGCGEGYFAETLLTTYGHLISDYVGFDVSETAVLRATKRNAKFTQGFPSVRFKVLNFEDQPHHLEPYLQNADLVIALETLYYAKHGCTGVLKKIDPFIPPETLFLNADSLGIYVCREFLHKKLGWWTVDKFMRPMWKGNGRTHSLIAFLDRK